MRMASTGIIWLMSGTSGASYEHGNK